jgi:hypothetical protein
MTTTTTTTATTTTTRPYDATATFRMLAFDPEAQATFEVRDGDTFLELALNITTEAQFRAFAAARHPEAMILVGNIY